MHAIDTSKQFFRGDSMLKITFIGAGSTIFAKNVLGDCLIDPSLSGYEIALYDIDPIRLSDSYTMLQAIKKKYKSDANIVEYHNRKESLRNASFVINAIQVGGYQPSTVIDFEIPKKYKLRQTIGDTLGIGGIFRALRTIHVLEDIAKDMHEVCPDAYFLNYSNPMAILTGYLISKLNIKAIGLCHSVQVCVKFLFNTLGMESYEEGHQSKIAGINHQAWLLEIKDRDGNDLYPEIKRRSKNPLYNKDWDLVRHDMMHRFGYYITESSEHTAEYTPWYIKRNYPELIETYKVPLDEYPRRCIEQISNWNQLKTDLTTHEELEHHSSNEYAVSIIKAILFNQEIIIHGNVMNHQQIMNLPESACVEVPCVINQQGIHPIFEEELPTVCAAINHTNINVQLLTMEAAYEKNKSKVYQAAYLDPHTSSELSMDEIKSLCDDLFEAHQAFLPTYKEIS
jgi:alpha-galactosidase